MNQYSDKLPERSAMIVMNDHDGCDSVVLLEWNSKNVEDGDALRMCLFDILTEWFRTAEGYSAFMEAGGSYTVSDLDPENDHLKPALEAQGIFNLRKRHISAPECSWSHDELLYEEGSQNDFDRANEERYRNANTSKDA